MKKTLACFFSSRRFTSPRQEERKSDQTSTFDIFFFRNPKKTLSLPPPMPAKKPRKFYAVAAGRATGVFRAWDECQRSVSGFSGASFKAFTTSEEAEAFTTRGRGGSNADGAASSKPSSSPKRARASSIAAAVGGRADDGDAPVDAATGAPSKRAREEEKVEKEGAKGTDAIAPTTAKTAKTSTPSSSSSCTFKQLADPQSLYALFFDGAARGNHVQGRGAVGGAGAVLYRVDGGDDGSGGDGTDDLAAAGSSSSSLSEVGRLCVPLGNATNNAAEWAALELGLAASAATGVRRLRALGDSKLVINQLTGEWRAKAPALAAARRRAAALVSGSFADFEARHVFREANGVADALSNEALDAGGWEGWKTPEGELHAWRKLELRGGGGGDEGEEEEEGKDNDGDGDAPVSSSSPPPPPPPASRRGGAAASGKKRFDWSARALFFGGSGSGSSGCSRRRGGPLFLGAAAATTPLALLQRPPHYQQLRAFAPPPQRRMMLPAAPPAAAAASSMRLILRAARMAFL